MGALGGLNSHEILPAATAAAGEEAVINSSLGQITIQAGQKLWGCNTHLRLEASIMNCQGLYSELGS